MSLYQILIPIKNNPLLYEIFVFKWKNKKNKRTYENNAIQIEIADDLETLVSDKRLGWRASHKSKARRRKRIREISMVRMIFISK